ncbi:hypothetical protein FEM48_Zijuj06G0175600 [Ziziphus jujuba var. spinosa]|uniref:T-complex protein 11-like protein 1 n=1 Tax=Ziziphus jujuba var. spinosa TaxID=714518 RepID=A0A978VAN4_ZIZJJ|nr:hypothetical protein FEM48_Zijuj06G0175600 [Ziziphus jujuba var. spinosa]
MTLLSSNFLQRAASTDMLKRLSILETAQIRLSKLDELQLAAKTEAEMRFEKEFNELDTKVQLCWRQFAISKKTTLVLAKAFKALEINEVSVRSMPFEQLAFKIESASTIQTTKALLDRLESRYLISCVTGGLPNLENIDHLLKHVAMKDRRGNTKIKRKGTKSTGLGKEASQSPVAQSRYPVRVLLCAYMIFGHPDAVFSGRRELENALLEATTNFIREFELLIETILRGPIQKVQEEVTALNRNQMTFRSQLEAFDRAWCSYLHHFVAWKDNDVKLLEEGLVRAACQLELFKMQTSKVTSKGEDHGPGHEYDRQPIQNQVTEDQKSLREKVQHLSGKAGLERLESALSDTLSRYSGSKEFACSLPSSTANDQSLRQKVSLDGSAVSVSSQVSNLPNRHESSSQGVHTLLGKNESSLGEEIGSSASSEVVVDGDLSSAAFFVGENELLVNQILHEHSQGFTDIMNQSGEDNNSLTAKVKETMEKAFWDGVMESMKEDDSDFSWILKLLKEVRDELCDADVGNVDLHYFRRILEFALVTLRKLSAPANDDEMDTRHTKFLKELEEVFQAEDRSKASCALAITKGLQFVLQEIQALKREISKARLRIVEPLIKGPAGLEYLRKAFANRHGSPEDASTSLPMTRQWLSSVRPVAEQEWHEYSDSLSAMTDNKELSQGLAPTTLRSGGSILMGKRINSETSPAVDIKEQPECRGETIDLFVRLGLLKLVSEVRGLTLEVLPETLRLNLLKLSLLVLQQTLASENLVTNPVDMENMVSTCLKQLSELLNTDNDIDIPDIVETIIGCAKNDHVLYEKLHVRKQIMTSMLRKSLQDDDAVFKRVSQTVYVAARGVVLGGSGVKGRELAEVSLRRVGAALLTDNLVKTIEVVVVVAVLSCSVHRAWVEVRGIGEGPNTPTESLVVEYKMAVPPVSQLELDLFFCNRFCSLTNLATPVALVRVWVVLSLHQDRHHHEALL